MERVVSQDQIIIGTRGSDLALWQANEAARLIPAPTEIAIVETSGDRFQEIALQGQLEQGFFTKEIEKKLLAGEIDIAVHSLKDLPTQIVAGLTIGAHLQRAAVSDLLIVNPQWHDGNEVLPVTAGVKVGAMSLRRQALLKLYAPQAEAEMIRGNVPSRIERCRRGDYGAVVLARAGVERLGLKLDDLLVYELSPSYWPPAPGQGVVGIEARADDERVLALLAQIDNTNARQAARLERQLLANFEGGCHTAFGAWATPAETGWRLLVGLESDSGWQQTEAVGAWESLATLGPASAMEFKVPQVPPQEELCLQLHW
jgi:hydroxymethylbilane synthase